MAIPGAHAPESHGSGSRRGFNHQIDPLGRSDRSFVLGGLIGAPASGPGRSFAETARSCLMSSQSYANGYERRIRRKQWKGRGLPAARSWEALLLLQASPLEL